MYHNNLTRLVPLPQLTTQTQPPSLYPHPSPIKVRLEYHVVYRIYSALLNRKHRASRPQTSFPQSCARWRSSPSRLVHSTNRRRALRNHRSSARSRPAQFRVSPRDNRYDRYIGTRPSVQRGTSLARTPQLFGAHVRCLLYTVEEVLTCVLPRG